MNNHENRDLPPIELPPIDLTPINLSPIVPESANEVNQALESNEKQSPLIDHNKIHTLLDELADFSVVQGDAALMHMLSGLCNLFNAQNACWSVLVRLPGSVPGDVFKGWRPRFWRFLHQPKIIVDKELEKLRNHKVPTEPDVSYNLVVGGDEPFLV